MFEKLLSDKFGEYQAFLRRRMVEHQIIARGINDPPVIEVLKKVKRHLFVEEHLRTRAYEDQPLPSAGGRLVPRPYIAALLAASLSLKGTEKVLELGAGAGYLSAILSGLAKEVFAVDISLSLSAETASLLAAEGCSNIAFRTGDETLGWPEKAPYDRILISFPAAARPDALLKQLSDSGFLAVPLEESGEFRLALYSADGRKVKETPLPAADFSH